MPSAIERHLIFEACLQAAKQAHNAEGSEGEGWPGLEDISTVAHGYVERDVAAVCNAAAAVSALTGFSWPVLKQGMAHHKPI